MPSAQGFQEYLNRVHENMAETHPTTVKYPEIAGPLAMEIAYKEWRKHRVFDHSSVVPGVKMPNGDMGYSINFAIDNTLSAVRTISLSRQEMLELRDQIDKELGR